MTQGSSITINLLLENLQLLLKVLWAFACWPQPIRAWVLDSLAPSSGSQDAPSEAGVWWSLRLPQAPEEIQARLVKSVMLN
jgi:hypothetical protein